jgi:vacuolar-type H+-ATPase subunit E/Vma4
MSLQKLITKIHDSARAEVAAIEKERSEQEAELKAAHAERLKEMESDISSQITAKKHMLKTRTEALARQKGKNAIARVKKNALEDAFSDALKKLQEGAIREKAETALKKGLEGELKPAKEGGFTVHGEKFDVDATFPTILNKNLKNELQVEASSILFS